MWDPDRKERDEMQLARAIREFVEHEIEHDGLARAIFKCRLFAINPMISRAELARLVAEHGMARRANKIPTGTILMRGRLEQIERGSGKQVPTSS